MDPDPLTRMEQLEHRVELLERELAEQRAGVGAVTAAGGPAHWPPPATRPGSSGRMVRPSAGAAWPAPAAAGRHGDGTAIEIDSEVVLKWGGVGLVVLAVAFAVSTAISRGWLGPELQLVAAVACSAGLVAAGLRVRSARPGWMHALCTGGVLALLTTCASNLLIDQAGERAALVATVVASSAGVALTRLVRSEWVGSATVIGGSVAWFVSGSGEPPAVASAIWVGAFLAITIALAVQQSWFAMRFVAHTSGLVTVLAVCGQAEGAVAQGLGLAVASLLAGSLAVNPSIGDMTSTWQQMEVQVAAVVGPWALAIVGAVFELDDDTALGLVAVGLAAALAGFALAARAMLRPAHVTSLLLGASVTLSIGLAVLLSTDAVLVALAVQGAGLVVLASRFGDSARVDLNAAALLVISSSIAAARMVAGWGDDLSIGDDLAHLAVIAVLAVAGWQMRQQAARQATALVVLALAMLWSGSVFVHLPQGQAIVSVIWAVLGTAVLVTGAVRKVPEYGSVGLVVLGITVAKLLTVDLREVDTLWRAALFLLIGLGFLRLGFLIPRLTGRERDG